MLIEFYYIISSGINRVSYPENWVIKYIIYLALIKKGKKSGLVNKRLVENILNIEQESIIDDILEKQKIKKYIR